MIALIVAGVLLYAGCSVAAGYAAALAGLSGEKRHSYDVTSPRNAAIAWGPFGLVYCLARLAAQSGERRATLEAARHKAELREIEAASREVEKLLAGSPSGRRG